MAEIQTPPNDEDRVKWFLVTLNLVLLLLVLSIAPVLGSVINARFSQGGEPVVNPEGDSSTLANCQSIPDDWEPHFDQAGKESGASPALIAAIIAGGEHYNYYTSKWPKYEETPAYATGLNPTKHHFSSREGWVRGPSQFKENTFAAYSPDAKRDGTPSRFGTNFNVEPYIEQLQPSLNATGAYLAASGGKNGASEKEIRKAIFAYNHANWYVDRVYKVYLEYLSCSGSPSGGKFIPYSGNKACPVGPGATASWGPVTRSNPHKPTYPGHEGIDIMGTRGIPIYAVVGGTVYRADNNAGFRVMIDDGQGHYWFYQHLQPNLQVKKGDVVKTGQLLGYMSNTGAPQSDVHLHLGIAKKPNVTTKGAGVRWDLWFYPYDFLHDIPCLSKTLRS